MGVKPLRLGLYGCGARTNELVDSVYSDKLVEVVCCYDVVKETREATAKKYKSTAVGLEEELLENEEVDAFIISLPPKYHAHTAMRVAETGKPIFLEKPVATTIEDGRALLKKISEKGVICRSGLAYRYTPVFRKLLDLIQDGTIGRVLNVFYHWVAWAALIPVVINEGEKQNWRGDPKTGGQLVYHCCHLFDLFRQIGKISGNGEIKSVIAVTNHIIFPKSPSENVAVSAMEYEGGAVAGFHFSEVSRQCDGFGRVEGTETTVEFFWNNESRIKIYENARRLGPRVPDRIIEVPDANVGNRDIMTAFIKEARGEQPVAVTVEDAIFALKIAFAIRQSAKEGRKVYIEDI